MWYFLKENLSELLEKSIYSAKKVGAEDIVPDFKRLKDASGTLRPGAEKHTSLSSSLRIVRRRQKGFQSCMSTDISNRGVRSFPTIVKCFFKNSKDH